MAETIDEVIFRADVALHKKDFQDVKKYVEQAVKQTDQEKDEYLQYKYHADKEEELAKWYSQCAYILFQIADLWNSLHCTLKAAIFSEKIELPFLEKDARWMKLLLQQPRTMLLRMHTTLRTFLYEKLGEVAKLAIKLKRWEKSLQIDQIIDSIFIWLRDAHSVGPGLIWQNPGRHEAFLRMARCYFNMNDHDNARVYCKLVHDHLSEYDDVEALEIFAKSLRSTESFKSALKYCKLALDCHNLKSPTDKRRLQNLQSDIERKMATCVQSTPKAKTDLLQNNQRAEELTNGKREEKRRITRKRRPNRAKRLEARGNDNIDINSNALQETTVNIYERTSSRIKSQQGFNERVGYGKTECSVSESDTDEENSNISPSKACDEEEAMSSSSAYEYSSEELSDDSESDTDEVSFYRKSCSVYDSKTNTENSTVLTPTEDISETIVHLNPSFLRKFEDRHPVVLKRKKLYQDMLPESQLHGILVNDEKCVRGTIKIEGPHEAICIPTRSADCSVPVKILGRGKIGQTFNGDEVVVELIHDKKSAGKRFGKVLGILDCKRHDSMKRKLFACTFDVESCNLVRPICRTVPKIHVLNREVSKKYKNEAERKFVVEIYNYDKVEGTLSFSKIVHLQRQLKASCVFIVAYISWSPRHVYPVGAIIQILHTGQSVEQDIKMLNILYKVPSIYQASTVKEVDCLLRSTGSEPTGNMLEGRTNLSDLWTYTIDPPDSEDLDDALSVEEIEHEYKVGVHIADVSSYVQKGSAVDVEALNRSQTFYSHIQNARYMLPEPLSKDLCSLLPNKLRLTVTVFFYISKTSFVINKTEIMKTYIKSKRKFTYKEVQDMIKNTEANDLTTSHIKVLFRIADVMRKQRLKNASMALDVQFEESQLANDDIGTSEAHYLVEELMILANKTVAEQLLKSVHRQCVPIRCHSPPPEAEVNEFIEDNGNYIDVICKLQDKQIGNKRPCFLSICDTGNKDVMVFTSIWRAMSKNQAYATNYLRKDDLHPIQHVIYQNWLSIQEHAEYRCSGTVGEHEGKHYGLDIFRYTHFTSPIRRYTDLVVHRLVHAAILQNTQCPYSKEEIDDICQHANLVSKKAKDYERGCKTLRLATELSRKPKIFTCYVNNCTDAEITFCTPTLRGQAVVQREIPFKLLDMAEKPNVFHDKDTHSNKVRAVWRKRLYNFHPVVDSNFKPDVTQDLNPHKDISLVPMQQWVQLLRILLERNEKEKETCCTYIIRKTKVVSSHGLPDVTTEHAAQIESEPTKGMRQQKSIVFQPSTKFSMTFSRGQRLNIQMTAVQQKGTTVLKPSLLNLTDNVKFCLQHTDDPVLYLSRYSSKATRDLYKDVHTYRDTWLPILSMEAATCVVRNEESCCLNDRPVIFNKNRTGKFVLDEEDCDVRNIEISGTEFEDDNRNEYSAPSYDWLCIKTSRSHVRDDLQCTARYIWVGHGEITHVTQKNGKLTISFTLHETSKFDDIIFDSDILFNIEILKKSEVDRRTESYIRELGNGCLAAQIALRKSIPDLDDDLVQIADEMDTDLPIRIKDDNAWKPLPRNNAMQKTAICKALKSRFTLIQGPPGTGKTQTAIKLICLFTKINNTKQRTRKDRNQVLFCGPSNKSVDLVAKWMLNRMGEHRPKFVRVYGRTIETEKFPIPGRTFLSKRSTKNQAADPELESVSLHHLIRKPNNTYSDEIKEFDKLFSVNKNKPMPTKEKEYAKLIAKASIEEMQKYDVILSTTAVGTNPKLLKATDISQIIVDEAGMCPEPNCLVPIIATKPTQVVLIGDHKQLRPIVMCKEAAALGLENSLFERYANNHSSTNVAFVMLNEQYRMDPEICKFPSEQFYDGALKTGKGRWCDDRMVIWPHMRQEFYPHVFVQIEGEEKILTVSTEEGNEQSRSNQQEVEHVVKVYSYFTREQPSDSVQIISQYNAQCHEIRAQLGNEGFVDVNVSTVVSSQGGEWDYVIFSTVRSLPHYKIERNPTRGWCIQNLGFITDKNQVNVALTRARKGLIIIGNKHLLSCDEVWKNLIDYYDVRGCILTPDQFPPPLMKTRQQIMAETKRKHQKRHGDAIYQKGEATSFKGPIDDKTKTVRGFRKK